MLNIPNYVKKAYRTDLKDYDIYGRTADERHKEVRIIFPNGEMRDLWNADIVQESFNFTESICSADTFKFGLCEAAEITFEVVNIEENFAGCEIDVYFEIDVSDLEAAHPGECAGRYTKDSNLDRSYDEVSRGVYSLPIGHFDVIECQRSKSNMKHRSVRAITRVFETNDDMTPFEIWRISQLHTKKTFKMPIPHYIDCQIAKISNPEYERYYAPIQDADWHYGQDEKVPDKAFPNSASRRVFCHNGTVRKGEKGHYPSNYEDPTCIAATIEWVRNDPRDVHGEEFQDYYYSKKVSKNAIYKIEKNVSSVMSQYASYQNFYTYFRDLVITEYTSLGYGQAAEDVFGEFFDDKELRSFYFECLFMFGVWYGEKVCSVFNALKNEYVMPYDEELVSETSTKRCVGRFIKTFSLRVFITHYIYTSRTPVYAKINIPYPIVIKESSYEGYDPDYYLKFTHTLDTKAKTYRYSFYDAFTMRNIIVGYLELHAMFGHQSRFGKYEYIQLKELETPSPDVEFEKTDFDSLYYEDYDIDDMGYIIYKYKKNEDDEEKTVIFNMHNGTSVYDMTDNEIFSVKDNDETITDKELKNWIENQLNLYFRPNVDRIHYKPVELKVHSKPYLEAGDLYSIIMNEEFEGHHFYTYNLSMTINGIQNQTTEIVSTSGQMINGSEISVDEDDDDT